MQQRQLRLGDILDDYCPRERRLTNHAVVAMIGEAVRLTRCTTCDSEHEYKHARQPRLRKKGDAAALSAPAPPAPKRVVHETPAPAGSPEAAVLTDSEERSVPLAAKPASDDGADGIAVDDSLNGLNETPGMVEEGPVHRQLIRAQLPRHEGQAPVQRQAPDFTIRQPAGRQNRFRPRQQRGGAMFEGPSSRANGGLPGNNARGGASGNGGRPPMTSRLAKRHGPPRKGPK